MILLATLLAICAPGPRDNCVVDGDTFWLAGERVRIVNVDTAEINGKCPDERKRALAARDRLQSLLSEGSIVLVREGADRDRYGRLLRRVLVNGRDVGERLIAESHARRWDGKRRSWC